MATGGIVHRGLRYELMPVSMLVSAAVPFCLLLEGVELLILRPTRHTSRMLISAAVPFCLLLKGVELLILRPTRHTSALLFHRVVSVSDGKITECFYDTRILRA